ncbi:hypothetical protein Q433_10075 [Bacillus subtilis subsp. subtilis str. OH 131.1]|uniref:DUF6731 family protein n=1 Tax=Bacillus subtilis TaxID=1423 RepID=UPI00049AF7CA|nr:DUF6731 family protein [Bacillus subtilis]AID00396.1 hypothetical protein Q433_10075 [Bacillus subtilis subsp. subtilis str. OH 131.1]
MSKRVKFDYFKVYARSYDQIRDVMEERLCNLEEVIRDAQKIHVADRIFSAGNDRARLQDIKEHNGKWELHFIRIRKDNFPLKAHDNGEVSFFDDMDEAEGFGEEVSALFDPENCVIMVRRNMFSLPPSSIASFFTSLIDEIGFTVLFKPLVHPKSMELLKQEHLIRSAEVSIADVKNASEKTKKSLGQILSRTQSIKEPVNIQFKIGLAQKGSKKYSKIPIYEDIENFANDPNANRVEIKFKENEDTKVETIDLINNRLTDFHVFSKRDVNPESRNILHDTVIEKMRQLYQGRVEEIYNTYE